MIRFLLTRGRRYTVDDFIKSTPKVRYTTMTYDRLIRSRRFASATTLFVDLDRLSYSDLELAGRIYVQMQGQGERVLNAPAAYKNRYTLLKLLHAEGINDFNAYRLHEIPGDLRFPAFVRKIQGHGLPLSALLTDRAALDACVRQQVALGVPLENMMVVEYVGEEVRPGLYRKISIFRIGDRIVPYLCGHDRDWIVKVGQKGVASEDLYLDELRLVRDNPHADFFRHVFELAGIEYGRADFGFYRGRIQVFEINTNPTLGTAVIGHPSPSRMESGRLVQAGVHEALEAIDTPRRRAVRLPRELVLNQHRGRHGIFNRTRLVD